MVLRSGNEEWAYSVFWNLGKLPKCDEICDEAVKTGEPVEVVIGAAPGWEDPWRDAVRARVIERTSEWVAFGLLDLGSRRAVYPDDIVAIRPLPASISPPEGVERAAEAGRTVEEPAEELPWPSDDATVC